jgi:hypothetical protein
MDALIHQMANEEKDLVASTYVLDKNCLDQNNCPAPEYVLVDHSEKLKTVTARKIFAALHNAVGKEFGQLRDLPRWGQLHSVLARILNLYEKWILI